MGNPLSKEVSTPNISFKESAFEVTSRPVDEGVTGPTSEPASTLSRISEEKEDGEVAISYVDLKSTITGEDSVQIASHYGLEVVMPCELEWL